MRVVQYSKSDPYELINQLTNAEVENHGALMGTVETGAACVSFTRFQP